LSHSGDKVGIFTQEFIMSKNIPMTELTDAVVSGFAAKQDENTIKGAMFAIHPDFASINTLYRTIAITESLIVDPAIVAADIKLSVEGTQWDGCETWDHVLAMVEGVVEECNGSTSARVLTAARKYCKENEIKLPKAVKVSVSRAKGSKVQGALVLLINAKSNATKQEAYDAVLPLVKGHKNAVDSVNTFFNMIYAASNQMSLPEALAELKDQTMPAK
jgi:hypothetical protein